jgi:hypothetical protein
LSRPFFPSRIRFDPDKLLQDRRGRATGALEQNSLIAVEEIEVDWLI